MFEITDFQKIGIGLTGFGLFFLFLGVVFIFDKGLLALGNLHSGFLPVAVNFLRRVPILGTILNFPILNKIIDYIAGDPNRSMV
ncbi:vesicle transport protein GOT1B-like [Parasteatoda tepidariorum]|uniref:vesicle transport protein GOT1B-like n=1 Tax=Parasteatoda tepidariorum TaxID=114398 RepID=UPI0039BCE04B